MDAERKERQKSICAARDWLSGAADAIAGEDDLAGDLKVMLARAELSRLAAARRKRVRRALRWIVPPLAALGVWAVVAWSNTPPAERAQALPASPVPQASEQRAPARVPAAASVQQEEPAQSAADTARAEQEGAQTYTAAQRARIPDVPLPEAGRADPPPQEAPAARQPQFHETIPTRDMQRLMQVGGKILRE